MQNAISAGHQSTLDGAKEILKANGNAFDAAIAAFFVMCVAEPCMASAGGNGFALTRTANGDMKFFDFFCQTPFSKKMQQIEFDPIEIDFGNEIEIFYAGLGAAAVPGSIAGVMAMHKMYGSIPMDILIQPAKELSKKGLPVSEFLALDLQLLEPILQKEQRGQEIFFKNGKVKVKGDHYMMNNFPDFLDFIAAEGHDGFYLGEIGKLISTACKNRGGFLRRKDFENFQANIIEPFYVDYHGHRIYLPNGPSKGGSALAYMLGQMSIHHQDMPQAIKLAQNVMQDEKSIKRNLASLYPNNNFVLQPSLSNNKGTSHFNIYDKKGNAVSFTSSLGEGCGYFIPGTDMQLNNMMGEVFLLPNGPHSWEPNTRMHSMMTPVIVTDAHNQVKYVGGSGGASRIPYAIGQVIHHLIAKKLSLEESILKSRVHYQDDIFQIEAGAHFPKGEEKANYWNNKSMYFGGVHSIQVLNNDLLALGDSRRHGVAEVF